MKKIKKQGFVLPLVMILVVFISAILMYVINIKDDAIKQNLKDTSQLIKYYTAKSALEYTYSYLFVNNGINDISQIDKQKAFDLGGQINNLVNNNPIGSFRPIRKNKYNISYKNLDYNLLNINMNTNVLKSDVKKYLFDIKKIYEKAHKMNLGESLDKFPNEYKVIVAIINGNDGEKGKFLDIYAQCLNENDDSDTYYLTMKVFEKNLSNPSFYEGIYGAKLEFKQNSAVSTGSNEVMGYPNNRKFILGIEDIDN